jgi:threonine dehydratase
MVNDQVIKDIVKKKYREQETMISTVTLNQIRAAAAAVKPFIYETPLLPAPELSNICGNHAFLKTENLQVTGSFKIRAAMNSVLNLPSKQISGVVASSSGNFAQAVAWAGSQLNIPVTIVMEQRSSPLKVARTRQYGAEVVFCENNFLSRDRTVERLKNERGLVMLHPYNLPEVVAGNGSIGLEIMAQWPDVDLVLVPVSGGGLISGIATALKELRPSVQIVGVQAETSNAAYLSFQRGEIVTLEAPVTIADGLRASPKEITFAHIQKYVDDFVLVSDEAIRRAVVFLLENNKLLVEPSGAVGVAALLTGKLSVMGKNVVAILSGGNISLDAVQEIRLHLMNRQ